MVANVAPELRTVNQVPLDVLWDNDGDIDASRERLLSGSALREMLRGYPVEFFVAEVGFPLRQVNVEKCYEFWNSEVNPHLLEDPDLPFRLDHFPGDYAYVASEWSGRIQTPIVLLEKHH